MTIYFVVVDKEQKRKKINSIPPTTNYPILSQKMKITLNTNS